MKPTPQEIEALKAKHGDVLSLHESDTHTIATRRPTRPQWQRFMKTSMDKDQRYRALEQLLRDTCVWPDAAGLDSMLDELPALAEVFGGAVAETGGLDQKVETKKL